MSNNKSTSRRRQDDSRADGRHSQGPATPEGTARASRNAVQHGCVATLVTSDPDEAALFTQIHNEYIARFEPRDQVEHDLVEEIMRAKWQMRQAWAYESAIIGLQVAQDTEKVDREWKSLGDHDRRALAYASALNAGTTLPNLQRYARSLSLQAEKAIKMLLELKQLRLPPADESEQDDAKPKIRNEPSPTFEHLESMPKSPSDTNRPRGHQVHPYALVPAVLRIPFTPTPEAAYIPAIELARSAG